LSPDSKCSQAEGSIKRPSHTTVVAYCALVAALGTGGAYALDRVTSADIRNGSIRSVDLRDGKGVRGRDVTPNAIGGKQIDEATLDPTQFLRIAGDGDAPSCDPSTVEFMPCVTAAVDLPRASDLLIVATGDQFTSDGDANGSQGACQLQVDGVVRGRSFAPGEVDASSHRLFATNGFARTLITPEPLPAGTHQIALVCSESSPDYWIGSPTLAVLAISAG
jgi:hypothetical protein